MADKHAGEIRINSRILRVGHQVYPLAHISRVQTRWVQWSGRGTTKRDVAVVVVVLVAVLILLPVLGLNTGGGVSTILIAVLAVGAIVVLIRMFSRQRRFVLLIETAGAQSTALAGPREGEIRRIEWEIVSAIENPPTEERTVNFSGDIIFGDKVGRDQYKQSGQDSTMNFNS